MKISLVWYAGALFFATMYVFTTTYVDALAIVFAIIGLGFDLRED